MTNQQPEHRLKLSGIVYLNTVPLLYPFYFGTIPEWLQVEMHTPAQSAVALLEGASHAGIVPSIIYPQLPDAAILSGISISSRRQVKSVVLAARKPLHLLRRVGLTSQSRTSAALLQIILNRFESRHVEYEPFVHLEDALARLDGALVIGDQAMTGNFNGCQMYDLAALWNAHTGLPFVFALWMLRPHPDRSRLAAFLRESKEAGLANVSRIAKEFGPRLGISEESVATYLLENITYDFGPDEQRSLHLFYSLCREMGLLTGKRPLEFIDA